LSAVAALVERLESLGVVLFSAPGGELRYRARKPVPDEARRLLDELRTVREEAATVLQERERPVPFPDEAERLRRRVARRGRTLRDLASAWCRECGFSAWAVSARGDASCYGCRLLARGITPACGRCKRREWRLENGRRVCRYCEAAGFARGDGRVAAPSAIAAPGESSREVSEPGGAA